MKHILYSDRIRINDAISVVIPKVGEVLEHEDDYFTCVSSIISTPYDMMVQLDEAGIDFTQIDNFKLFCMLFSTLQDTDTSLLFSDLDLSKFVPAVNEQTQELVLLEPDRNIVIDRAIHEDIAIALRQILQIKKHAKKPGNEEGRKYMIRIAKMNQKKQRRLMKDKDTSQLEDLIISLVNCTEFPYTYESVRGITIHQLYQSFNQVSHKIRYDNTMAGYYAGNIKIEDLSQEERTWVKT